MTDQTPPDQTPPDPFAGVRVLVTGARGFIGRRLVRHLLAAGARVHATARPGTVPRSGPVAWHGVDVADHGAVERVLLECAPRVVFHLAGQALGRRDPALVLPMLEDNVRGAVNVLAAAQRLGGIRVVLAGSIEESRDGEAASSPYAASKAAATEYARMFHGQWDLPVTVLRPTMTYGPDQPNEAKLLPSVITAMLAGTEPALGDGSRLIDWVHVDDVCRAFLAAADAGVAPGAVVDVGSGTATSIADTVETCARLTGYRGPLGFGALGDRRHDDARIADTGPARRLLGWSAQVGLEEGLADLVAWHRGSYRDGRTEPSRAEGRTCC